MKIYKDTFYNTLILMILIEEFVDDYYRTHDGISIGNYREGDTWYGIDIHTDDVEL